MSEIKLTKTRIRAGVWEGVLRGAPANMTLEVVLQGQLGANVTQTPIADRAGEWAVRVPIAPEHLSELTQAGIRGVRLSPAANASGDWIRGPLMKPLWKRCEQLQVPMNILAPISRMPDIGAPIDQFPDLTIVIDHMADCPVDQPAELEKLIALKRHPMLFVKVSHTWSLSRQAYPWRDAQDGGTPRSTSSASTPPSAPSASCGAPTGPSPSPTPPTRKPSPSSATK